MRAAERGAVRVGRAEVRVPRVEVGVEVDQRDRSVALVHRAQHRQRDGVVAAEHDGDRGVGQERPGARLDLGDRLVDRERRAGDVAGVGHLLVRERSHLEPGVVAAQQPGPRADRRGPEAGAGPVGRPAVERHADDGDVAPVDLVEARQPRERRRPREPRHDQRVDRAERRVPTSGVLHRSIPSRAGQRARYPGRGRARHPC